MDEGTELLAKKRALEDRFVTAALHKCVLLHAPPHPYSNMSQAFRPRAEEGALALALHEEAEAPGSEHKMASPRPRSAPLVAAITRGPTAALHPQPYSCLAWAASAPAAAAEARQREVQRSRAFPQRLVRSTSAALLNIVLLAQAALNPAVSHSSFHSLGCSRPLCGQMGRSRGRTAGPPVKGQKLQRRHDAALAAREADEPWAQDSERHCYFCMQSSPAATQLCSGTRCSTMATACGFADPATKPSCTTAPLPWTSGPARAPARRASHPRLKVGLRCAAPRLGGWAQ
jgi:hypothetical protein